MLDMKNVDVPPLTDLAFRGTLSCSSEGHSGGGMQSVIVVLSAGSRGVTCRGAASSR